MTFIKKQLLLLLLLTLAATAVAAAAAQDAPTWGEPVNVSQSGAASAPILVVDADGRGHVLWSEEAINAFVYARQEGDGWSRPFPVELPFATNAYLEDPNAAELEIVRYTPTLLADNGGRIHAFWRGEDNALFYSQVPADQFASFGAWSQPQRLAESVVALAAAVDGGGRVHLAYVRNLDNPSAPAGVYTQRAFASQGNWSGANLLVDSSYFRAATEATALLDIAAPTDGRVWVAWQNPVLEQVLLVGSGDGGQTWGDTAVIDKREADDSGSAVGPTRPQLAAAGPDVHLFWQAGHGSQTCTQYQLMLRDGQPVGERQAVPFSPNCAGDLQFVPGSGSEMLAALPAGGGLTLAAWDGARWSDPQPQTGSVRGFVDPQSQRAIALDCLQFARAANDQLLQIGCDTAVKPDIWSNQRPLGSPDAWFAPPSIWASPVEVASEGVLADSITAVVDANGRGYLFWLDAAGAVRAARQSDAGWTAPVTLRQAQVGPLPVMAATADASGNLLLAWVDATSGSLSFSRVAAERATSPGDWSEPVVVPTPRDGATTPDLLALPNGSIALAYALPVNEGRGIYLTRSTDEGRSWDEPVLVFDASAVDWPTVDSPRLASTGLDGLHVFWQRRLQAGDPAADALFYARSDDGGDTWSLPDDARSGTEAAAGSYGWADMVGLGEQVLHRAWLRQEGDRFVLWHQLSLDAGVSWERASALVDSGATATGAAALAASATGDVRLLWPVVSGTAVAVEHAVWNGSDWERAEPLLVGEQRTVDGLSAGLAGDGLLAGLAGAGADSGLVLGSTAVVVPVGDVITAVPTVTPTVAPTPTVTPTPAAQPTPTVAFARERDEGLAQVLALPGIGGRVAPIVLGAIPAVLIVLLGLLVGVRMVRRKR